MQSWPNQGQNGADGHDSWQSNFNFASQNGQFDHGQQWPQPMNGQNYARQLNSSDLAANFLQDPHAMIPNYQENHGSFDMGQQYPPQDVLDPTFNNVQPDQLYGQQDKLSLGGDNIHQMGQLQGHPHPQAQGFTNHDYSTFASQHDQAFSSAAPQFAQNQGIPQGGKPQQSHAPVQQFSNVQPNNFTQAQLRQTQHSPVQHASAHHSPAQHSPAQHSPVQPHAAYNPNAAYGHVNGHGSPYQPSPVNHANYQMPQQTSYQQSTYPHGKPFPYQQQAQSTPSPGFPQSAAQQQVEPHTLQPAVAAASTPEASTPQSFTSEHGALQRAPSEPPVKKRKRVVNSAADSPALGNSPQRVNSPMEPVMRRPEEIDGLAPPAPSPEDAQVLQQFNKRTKAAQAKFPPINGLPYLAHGSTIKLPAPKSYDKLAPLVALPPRSKKPIVPELGYDLPCETQGKFTNQYRPAFDKLGLDERRIEAKPLLDEFDRSMKSLGKKRPKYTEYPHAFKEQLKADEASKNKAEKRAKKEQEEERSKPVRAVTRPADPLEAVRWDVIGIVHIDASESKTTSIVATRVQQAGDLFIKLRGEMNQAKQELDQVIKENRPDEQIQELKKAFERKKEALYRALDATIEHADDSIMDNLGGHHKLVLSLINILISSIKMADFSGKLPKVVLELFTHFPMTRKIAETTNFDTVRKRFADKGDSEVKDLVREISAKVRKVVKSAEGDSSTGYTGTSAASRAAKAPAKTASSASGKRGRDDDTTAETRTVKKVAVEPGNNSLSRKLAQPKIQLQSASKTTAAKAAASSLQMEKPRAVAKPAPKAELPHGGEHANASSDDTSKFETKKMATKVEGAKAISKTDGRAPTSKTNAPPPSASSSALSGIASLLDSINAPRPTTPPNVPKESKEPDIPETAEEKAKRLRKEARRKLRVTWKPEAELVQVKIFEKEEGEDQGRDGNMTRDAADDRAEGMVLKRGVDAEEEEEDDDIPYQPWFGPALTDLSLLDEDTRNKNYTSRGGNVAFSTDEQKHIAEREQRELMAIYTDPDDIPPSPKSPPPQESADPATSSKIGHLPNEGTTFEEIQLRWRDEQQMGVDGALYTAMTRLTARAGSSNKLDSILGRLQGAPSQTSGASSNGLSATPSGIDTNVPLVMGATIMEQVITWLRSETTKQWKNPSPINSDPSKTHHYSDPAVQDAGVAIEYAITRFAGMLYPATAPPDWLANDEERVREWWMCHNKESTARRKREEEERARAEAETNALRTAAAATGTSNQSDWSAYYAQQQQAYAPYMAILQQMNGGQGQAQAQAPQQNQVSDNQLQSILAAMSQPQQQPQQQPAMSQPQNSSSFPNLNPNDPSYQQLLMLTQMAQGNMQGPSGGERDREHDRDRDRDRDWDRHDRHDDYGRDGYRGKDKKKKPGPTTIHKPPNAALIGTKPCSFWQQGKCARGDQCTFRHG